MLMVVFGAGSSYDSFPSLPAPKKMIYRPPIAKELFEPRDYFIQIVSRFEACQPIIPFVRHPRTGASVEQVLEELQNEGEQRPERYRQLAAIRHYLQFIISHCDEQWSGGITKGVTNFKTLLDEIEQVRKPEERVCLVTFNYDTLLERNLPSIGIRITSLDDYVSNQDYKLIKLHGSVNWGREVETPIDKFGQRDEWSITHELIDRAAELNISRRYRLVDGLPVARLVKEGVVLFPAVALPVERKRDYECPDEHLDVLHRFIPEVTKLLVIGWRGTEYHFLQMLAEKLRKDLRVMVVSGDDASEVILRLQQAGVGGHFSAFDRGFTQFILERNVIDFLRG